MAKIIEWQESIRAMSDQQLCARRTDLIELLTWDLFRNEYLEMDFILGIIDYEMGRRLTEVCKSSTKQKVN